MYLHIKSTAVRSYSYDWPTKSVVIGQPKAETPPERVRALRPRSSRRGSWESPTADGAKLPLLSSDIDILNQNAVKASVAPPSGTPSFPPLTHFVQSTDCAYFPNLNTLACGRLIRRAFDLHELPSLIETIFSSKDESDEIHSLLGGDAQTFVDVMNEARYLFVYHRESVGWN